MCVALCTVATALWSCDEDETYADQKEKERKKKQPAKPKAPSSSANKFNNFESRSYDMNDLELRLLQQ